METAPFRNTMQTMQELGTVIESTEQRHAYQTSMDSTNQKELKAGSAEDVILIFVSFA